MSKELLAIDYAGIEARLVAWIAGESWKLHAFEMYDRGEGPNNYCLAASRLFQIPVERVKKGTPLYHIGKIVELASGFEGGIGALIKAINQNEPHTGISLDMVVELADGKLHDQAMESARWMLENGYLRGHGLPERTLLVLDAMKASWRLAHPATAGRDGAWRQLKDAAIMAVRNPGQAYTIDSKIVHFKMIDRWLYMQLPSRRRIAYFQPEVVGEPGTRNEHLQYSGVDTEKRIWTRTATYGGKLMQNACEGIGRDLLVHGMHNLEAAGVPMIMSVHDEAVGEMEAGLLTMSEALKVFLNRPAWSAGLPLAAEGFIGKRYRK